MCGVSKVSTVRSHLCASEVKENNSEIAKSTEHFVALKVTPDARIKLIARLFIEIVDRRFINRILYGDEQNVAVFCKFCKSLEFGELARIDVGSARYSVELTYISRKVTWCRLINGARHQSRAVE